MRAKKNEKISTGIEMHLLCTLFIVLIMPEEKREAPEKHGQTKIG